MKAQLKLVGVVIISLSATFVFSRELHYQRSISKLQEKIEETEWNNKESERKNIELEKQNGDLMKSNKKLEKEKSNLEKDSKLVADSYNELKRKYDELNKKYNYEINQVRYKKNSTTKKPVYYDSNNVTKKSYASTNDIEKVLAKTNLKGLGSAYVKAEKTYGVNAIFLVSITALESGWGTSNRAKRDNNISGFEVYNASSRGAVFDSKEESIMITAKLLSKHYLTPKGKNYHGLSARAVNEDYCPDGGIWSSKVNAIAKNVVKEINSR